MRRLLSSCLFILVSAVALVLLPGPMASTAVAAEGDVSAASVCFLDEGGNVRCPDNYPAPNLWSTGDLLAARPTTAAALLRLQEQAIDNTLAAHNLPASDRGAVMTWGRSEAQTQLWSLVYAALTADADERTVDQQLVVQWMNGMLRAQATASALSAAREYVKWAGLSQHDFRNLVRSGASDAEFQAFLAGPVVNFNQDRSGGYCVYRSPAPYQDEYKGHTSQMCFTGCTIVCSTPTPKFEQFVQWGQATLPRPQLDPSYMQNAAAIAIGATYGATALALPPIIAGTYSAVYAVFFALDVIHLSMPLAWTAQGVAAGTALAADLASIGGTVTSAGAEVAGLVLESAPAFTAAGELTGAAWTASAVASASAIAGAVAVVITALVTVILGAIKLRDELDLPGKLAALIQTARTTPQDAGALTATQDGVSTLFNLFAGSTFPTPRPGTCENPVLPHYGYYDEAGQVKFWDMDITADLCLNPTPVPKATATDPHFVIRGGAGNTTAPTRVSPSIELTNVVTALTQKTRVTGNWFVSRFAVTDEVQWTPEGQSLRLDYTDWANTPQRAWLVRDPDGGYLFAGVAASDSPLDAATCQAEGTCWTESEIRYLGPDGKNYAARLDHDGPATGSPTMTTAQPLSASPVSFAANDFGPADAVAPLTYRWRFQIDDCGGRLPCVAIGSSSTTGGPAYSAPVSGASASYTWQTSGTFQVELTATDAQGRTATTTVSAAIGSAPPALALTPACTVTQLSGCENRLSDAGDQVTLTGTVTHPGAMDSETVTIDWGDGTPPVSASAGPGVIIDASEPARLTAATSHRLDLSATHTYTAPGRYYGSVTVRDLDGNIDQDVFVQSVRGPQTITFGTLADRRYGDRVTMSATGGGSGRPVTFTAGPPAVCSSGGTNGALVTAVGLGRCTVTANQAGIEGSLFLAAPPVSRSFEVTPAPVEIEPEPKVKVYGAPNPEFTVHVGPLVNGDTVEDFPGLVVAGPAADSDVGLYDIVASGAVNPNYEIRYDTGTLEVRRAELRVTAQDRARVYGDPLPAYTAAFEGLVNGDTAADITGLLFSGPAKEAGVGAHPVRVEGGTNPNYLYTYRDGTETITPAPLRVTANDVTRRYGRTVPYTARYQGLVNGEAGLPGLRFAGADPEAGVGQYPIVVTGTPETHYYDNYDITWIDGTETVTPAPLSIRADNQTRLYGAPAPAYTTALTGLTNGDTRADITGLSVTGAPGGAGVGSYPIEAKGAVNPNYDITYLNGTETVNRAPLAITAHDKSQVYGAPDPTFTASYDGLVNGDTESAVTGLQFAAAPTGSDVGSYPIVPSGATSPNYAISYTHGTQTITPAPLTIRATDKAARYGTVATYTWTGHGWVNGDSDDTIETAPTCTATVQGAAASVTTNPGAYPGAIGCADAADPNYTIGYASGDLTVNPVVRLTQSGLPTTVPHRAYIDGQPIALPTGEVEFGYDTTHTYAFPAVVTDPDGVPHMTTTPGFNGPVTANATITATYTTMTALLTTAVANGGTDQKTATTLTTLWNQVQAGLKTGNTNRTSGALKQFADQIRSQTGKKITKPTATTLLTYTQLVHTSNGGKGTI